jgi:SAM-dependent methyltransferase
MSPPGFQVVTDPHWGYRRLDPIPTSEELHRFYQSAYADVVAREQRAPELTRLLAGGPEADAEREWLRATLFADILAHVSEHAAPGLARTAIDVGAGTGEWVAALADTGWDVTGLEPAEEMAELATSMGRPVLASTVEEYLASTDRADSIAMVSAINVLEHLPDPVAFCDAMHELLAPGGLLVLRVPNEFNPLQLAAQAALGIEPWWIVAPDHISYFDYESLARLLEGRGFEVVSMQSDFPMELFLLMGDVYIGNPDVGRDCHAKRRRAELAMGPEARRSLYRSLAASGLGRNCLVIARRR